METKDKKNWFSILSRWMNLATELEVSGCRIDYNFSIYSGSGSYVSFEFNVDGHKVNTKNTDTENAESIKVIDAYLAEKRSEVINSLKEEIALKESILKSFEASTTPEVKEEAKTETKTEETDPTPTPNEE